MTEEILEEALGHHFGNRRLLDQALTHSSYAAENPGTHHNERFEFLGDALLQLAVTEHLFATYPDLPEGQMTKIRASAVNGLSLADVARRLGVGRLLRLGRGEESTGGREKDSILGDAMEALFAAVYLDGGYPATRRVVLDLLGTAVDEQAVSPDEKDHKTRLQEFLAPRGIQPAYEVIGEGPDHERHFTAEVHVEGTLMGRGRGRSKREAQQEAAREAIDSLEV
jgi:ribonuclease III